MVAIVFQVYGSLVGQAGEHCGTNNCASLLDFQAMVVLLMQNGGRQNNISRDPIFYLLFFCEGGYVSVE